MTINRPDPYDVRARDYFRLFGRPVFSEAIWGGGVMWGTITFATENNIIVAQPCSLLVRIDTRPSRLQQQLLTDDFRSRNRTDATTRRNVLVRRGPRMDPTRRSDRNRRFFVFKIYFFFPILFSLKGGNALARNNNGPVLLCVVVYRPYREFRSRLISFRRTGRDMIYSRYDNNAATGACVDR